MGEEPPKERKSYATGIATFVGLLGVGAIVLFTASPNAPKDKTGVPFARISVLKGEAEKYAAAQAAEDKALQIFKHKQDSIRVQDSLLKAKEDMAKKAMKPKRIIKIVRVQHNQVRLPQKH